MYPIGCEKTSASIPSVLRSPASDASSLILVAMSFFFGPTNRLKNDARFLDARFRSAGYSKLCFHNGRGVGSQLTGCLS